MRETTARKRLAIALMSMAVLAGCGNTAANNGSNTDAATTVQGTTASYDGTVASQPTDLKMSDLVTFDEEDTASDWSASGATTISLGGSDATISGAGAAAENGSVKITAAGTYILSGTLSDGQIVVEAGEEDRVRLVLNGVDITDSDNAPIYVKSADKTVITLATGTKNTVTDGSTYALEADSDEPTAAIFSKDDLSINGTGSLTVHANDKDGIASKDDLLIAEGTYTIKAADDGIVGKDLIAIKAGTFDIEATGDGMKSSNDKDADKGVIAIGGGTFHIVSGNDGIQAETTLLVDGGTYDLSTGGGIANAVAKTENGPGGGMGGGFGGGRGGRPDGQPMGTPPDMGSDEMLAPPDGGQMNGAAPDEAANAGDSPAAATEDGDSAADAGTEESTSSKSLKAGVNLVINDGDFTIDSAEDTLHSNGAVTVNGGTFGIQSGDDGVHADTVLTIAGGKLDIKSSYEGLEAATIVVSGGEMNVTASDDGVNGSGTNAHVSVSGGSLTVNAGGDGLDSNGDIEMSGGTVIVSGPTNDGNGTIDYDGDFAMTGGLLIGAGSSGMAQSTSEDSSQSAFIMTYSSTQTAGTLVHVEDSQGNTIATFAPAKDYTSFVISSPDLKQGETYTIYSGGTSNGTATNGLYADGAYSGGTKVVEFKLESVSAWINESGVTTANTGHGMGGGGGRR
ncbi:carbohydrate-binding domain-containing protein [Cohnella sp. AR92]|uniref:carbohydrate-binding domain-containing protein n=1 Tax=Cohnella sp. AR92 TaxID=648716 RepID=UPI0013158001|nr:carbohydrate-binding domain-containing protein [Cohnella sp. AR92]